MGAALDSLTFKQETEQHKADIEDLLNRAFGPGRFTKTAERLREGNHPIDELCLVAFEGSALLASVRFWPIHIGASNALLLGPLAVEPNVRGRGVGLALMKEALDKASLLERGPVLLVGDAPYYEKVGFKKTKVGDILMPGPVDPNRLLLLQFNDGSAPPQGMVSVPRGTK